MSTIIQNVLPGSAAEAAGLQPGQELLRVNGHTVRDVLDWRFYSYDARLRLEIASHGRVHRKVLRKAEGEDAGLEFDTYLMDEPRHCANKCVFCFIDQLPKGLRRTLYFKDDDARLSFLMGNYITLTNLSEEELERMIRQRISPVNVSVHAADPAVRCRMLNNPRAGNCMEIMRRLADAGIEMNCQIVVCPGWNDGEVLQDTMEKLALLYPQVPSVSIVPVGLTRYRENLTKLEAFDRESASKTLAQVAVMAENCLQKLGSRIFFCSDELYLKAGETIPEEEAYEGYPQLENGVGMLRSLEEEFRFALEEPREIAPCAFSAATGLAAKPLLEKLAALAEEKFPELHGTVYGIRNDFFGPSVDVAGLVTGGDLIAQLRGKELNGRLLIPDVMLRRGEEVFLDDVTLDTVERELGVRCVPVPQDGGALLRAMLNQREETENV